MLWGISIVDVLESKWSFSNDREFLGYMTFNPDRTISTYDNNNERFWELEGDLLIVYDKDHKATVKYI